MLKNIQRNIVKKSCWGDSGPEKCFFHLSEQPTQWLFKSTRPEKFIGLTVKAHSINVVKVSGHPNLYRKKNGPEQNWFSSNWYVFLFSSFVIVNTKISHLCYLVIQNKCVGVAPSSNQRSLLDGCKCISITLNYQNKTWIVMFVLGQMCLEASTRRRNL